MARTAKIILLAACVAALAPAAASAAPRMFVGFQDDPSFRWREDRASAFDQARAANSTVVRTTVYWMDVAPERPANPADSVDPAYRLDDLDEFVRNAQQRGMEVLLTIWGTPAWANDGQRPNRLPTDLSELTTFARALAERYSGRHAGFPYVRFWSIWNEPNLERFLAPQFDASGRSVSPELYARLFRAGYSGIKAASPTALVAIGETSPRGRDRVLGAPGTQETHSPGRFAELLAKADRGLRFDAWAHHPYPTSPRMAPTQRVRWPNVTLSSLPQFEASLDRWFGRKNIPIWISEYAHETVPDPLGIPVATQAAYLRQAMGMAQRDSRVSMFIWFILRDHAETPWGSGVIDAAGAAKPALSAFSALARVFDARNAIVTVTRPNPVIRLSAVNIAYYGPAGTPVGGNFWVRDRAGKIVAHGQPLVKLEHDAWITLRISGFRPMRGQTYSLLYEGGDINGNNIRRTLTLVWPKPPTVKKAVAKKKAPARKPSRRPRGR